MPVAVRSKAEYVYRHFGNAVRTAEGAQELCGVALGIGDGVGFIMDFICGVVERYAGDFYIAVFMCYVGHLLASHP